MKYFYDSFSLAGFLSVTVAFAAVLAVVFGAVFIASVGAFLVLFPLVLMTLPAIKRLAKHLNYELREETKTKRDPAP